MWSWLHGCAYELIDVSDHFDEIGMITVTGGKFLRMCHHRLPIAIRAVLQHFARLREVWHEAI